MKIAVTYQDGQIERNFDETTEFKIYDVFKNQIVATVTESIYGYGRGVLVGFLQDQCINMLICGNIGRDDKAALTMAGIAIRSGIRGDANKAIEEILSDSL